MPRDDAIEPAQTRPPAVAARTPLNYASYVALCCGVASLVPWVIVITFPCALACGCIGLVRSVRRPELGGRGAALMGMGLAVGAAVLHLALAGLAGLVGWLLDL